MRQILFIFSLLISLQSIAAVYSVKDIPNPKTYNNKNYVSNPDRILSESAVAELNNMFSALEAETQTEVAVVLIESIGDEVVEFLATSLFKEWGVGKTDHDNGLLVLFVLDQRALRFETGYGLEGVLPDILGHQIQQEFFFPHFRNADYDKGFVEGMQKLIAALKQEEFISEAKPAIIWSEVFPFVIAGFIAVMLISLIWISSVVKTVANDTRLKTNLDRYKALKSQKGGILMVLNILTPSMGFLIIFLFFNPIYLIFLILIPLATIPGNLYGKWMMRRFRRKSIPCTSCEGKMHILSEKKEDAYLKVSQQFEEELNSVDYDVFLCDDCGNEAVFTLDKPSIYSECPRCKTKAYILKSRKVIVAPSYINSGTERATFKCKFCGYEDHKNTNLPRLTRTAGSIAAGSAAGSVFSGRGGFGGGGFGGGGFGGGRSGGGGVTGRW